MGYPQSNAIEMTSVHGITVAGGTFPAEIWHAFYTNAGVACEPFRVPAQPIQWSSFFGTFTASEPVRGGSGSSAGSDSPGGSTGGGGGGTTHYDPQLYAPGAGQAPAPPPPSPPAPSTPPPPPSQGESLGGGTAAPGN